MPPKKTAAKKSAKKPVVVERSMAEIMEEKQARTKTVTIQLNGGIVDAISALQLDIINARKADRKSNTPDLAPKLEKQLEKLLEAGRATEQAFVFTSIGREIYEKMLGECKPNKIQKQEGAVFNPDTFGPRLIAASATKPEINVEQITEMFASPEWNAAELAKLFLAAQEANVESPDIPLSSSAIGSITDSISNLITQQISASHTRSS